MDFTVEQANDGASKISIGKYKRANKLIFQETKTIATTKAKAKAIRKKVFEINHYIIWYSLLKCVEKRVWMKEKN